MKNGEVVLENGLKKVDLFVDDGKIVKIGAELSDNADEVVDCSGKIVLPGLIDAHVHFRDPGQEYKEDFESGSRAALAGGITTVLDMPNNKPPVVDQQSLDSKRDKIRGRSYVNYGFYVGYAGGDCQHLNRVNNIAGVKVYGANSTGDMGVSDADLEKFFKTCDKKIVVHAEDEGIIADNKAKTLLEVDDLEPDPDIHSRIRSSKAEASAIRRVCMLARQYGKKVHIAHLSTAEGLDLVERYRDFGVSCEVSPHHLTLCRDDYAVLGNFIKVNPPIRDREDIFALWMGLKSGSIDIIATDHAPHTVAEKEAGYRIAPAGIPEEDTLLPLFLNSVNDDAMTIEELVKLCCSEPAKLFGIKNKGIIKEHFDADLVVVDMELEKKVENKNILSKCGWSPYAGSFFKGWPIMTFVNGKKLVENGRFLQEPCGREVSFIAP